MHKLNLTTLYIFALMTLFYACTPPMPGGSPYTPSATPTGTGTAGSNALGNTGASNITTPTDTSDNSWNDGSDGSTDGSTPYGSTDGSTGGATDGSTAPAQAGITPSMQLFILGDGSIKVSYLNAQTGSWDYKNSTATSTDASQDAVTVALSSNTTVFQPYTIDCMYPWVLPNQLLTIIYLDTSNTLKYLKETSSQVLEDPTSSGTTIATGAYNPVTAIDASGNFTVYYQTADGTGYKAVLDSTQTVVAFKPSVALASSENIYTNAALLAQLQKTSASMALIPPLSVSDPTIFYSSTDTAALQTSMLAAISSFLLDASSPTVLSVQTYEEFFIQPTGIVLPVASGTTTTSGN